MSTSLQDVCQHLALIAPLALAESWDNVGLLVGDRASAVQNVMTCLTVTPSVVTEAVESNVDLVVTHHPVPFRPLSKITTDSLTGEMLWRLIRSGVAVYSAHTAFDSAGDGINQSWAKLLHLTSVGPIIDPEPGHELGAGRVGVLPAPTVAREVIERCVSHVNAVGPRYVGPIDRTVSRVGFACGSGGSFVAKAHRRRCELLITGEATFHQCLEAESFGMTLALIGHYYSERFAMERLATQLGAHFPELNVWASRNETNPVHPLG
ncbi:Nif3-like dinuclear metal center hexameric protein [Rhodopirellula sp. MGV]|uniref:Nif3-like dinuclear metal center hexameric protein n=1 Tax=Rhodopirellula sp. MGV TaxID=2023130 RepID=UPI000B970024|nr:Nif3-like dinuclear metal center hexameric protein [Rhodopirellula sp. MGV]OYP36045.1 Nif3-like dinuclear metal center hexameric protein [Rhodopirellula sp. MGV]PNY36596.1 Nif3-like dinuclear metal center hexameric protein [Rhodopirellula baltica]